MSKVSEFYKKAIADETAKNELIAILGDNKLENASDEQLVKIGELAKKLGYDITIEEAKAYLNKNDSELDDDALEAVAGGKHDNYNCTNGVGTVIVDL